MSSEAITRNDLTAILNEVLPPTPSEYRKLLWTNPSPTSSFAAQTVSIDVADYDAVSVEFSGEASHTTMCERGISYYTLRPAYAAIPTYRASSLPATNGVYFDDCHKNSGSTIDNTQLVPYKIYGIKYERVAQPQLESNALIFRDYTLTPKNATYSEEDIDIGVTGYTPISTFWNTNQIGLFIYNMRLKDKSTLSVGRSMDNGATLSSNYLYIKVAYLLDVLVGL